MTHSTPSSRPSCSAPSKTSMTRSAHIARALEPGGVFLFIEHVGAPKRTSTRAVQHLAEPIWKRCAGNCHLTRHTEEAMERAGFDLLEITREPMRRALPILKTLDSRRGATQTLSWALWRARGVSFCALCIAGRSFYVALRHITERCSGRRLRIDSFTHHIDSRTGHEPHDAHNRTGKDDDPRTLTSCILSRGHTRALHWIRMLLGLGPYHRIRIALARSMRGDERLHLRARLPVRCVHDLVRQGGHLPGAYHRGDVCRVGTDEPGVRLLARVGHRHLPTRLRRGGGL